MNYAPQDKYQRVDCYQTLEQEYLYDSFHGVNSGQHATEKDRRWNPQKICTIAPINQNLDSDYPDKCLIFTSSNSSPLLSYSVLKDMNLRNSSK